MSANRGHFRVHFAPLAGPLAVTVAPVKLPTESAVRPLRNRLAALCLGLAGSATFQAGAQVSAPTAPEAQIPPAALARALVIVRDAAQAVAPRGARIDIEPGRLDARLALAPCSRAEAYLPPGVPAWGRVRVGLRCTEGPVRWNVFLPVSVQVVAPAIVVSVALPAGGRLEESHLRRLDVDWSAAAGPLFEQPDALAGRVLARAIAAGQPLQEAHLQARLWFAAGETVRIVATGPGFSIVSEGQALTAGQEGKPARIQTDNGRILMARPIADHKVEVNL